MNNDSALKLILNSMEMGVVLTGPENKILFINSYLQKILDVYVYNNLTINDIFEVFIENNKIEPDVICGYPDAKLNGVIFNKEPLILATQKNDIKVVSIKTIKNVVLYEKNITSLILIQDVSEKNELDKMKIDFSSQAVHILRTPVTIIDNNIDLFQKSDGFNKLNETEQKNFNEIKYGTTQLLKLIENLISINEIESEKLKLHLTKTGIVKVIETAVKELEAVKVRTGNTVLIVPPLYELPDIKIDVLKFVSVFKGIVTNSLKHTVNGQVLIKISKINDELILEFEDNGEGIPEVGLRFIFTKFYHSKKNPLLMEEGLGIGLFYCKKIVEAHLGTIDVESTVGLGTKVIIKLKLS